MQSTSEWLLKDFFNLRLRIPKMKCHFRKRGKHHHCVCYIQRGTHVRKEISVRFQVQDKLAISLRGFVSLADSILTYYYNFLKLSL